MQLHVISFYGFTSRIRFMFPLFPQHQGTEGCYMLQTVGTNLIIVLMFVESQRMHIQSTCKVCNKNLECCSIK